MSLADAPGGARGSVGGGASPSTVREWADGEAWDAFVDSVADATIAHRWAWREVMTRAYALRSFSLAAVGAGRIRGVLPLVLVRSRLFGRRLVSMPFLDTGGLCTGGDVEAADALLQSAMAIAAEHRVGLELRHAGDRPLGLPTSLEKITMVLPLENDRDAQLRALPAERRNRIRRGHRLGVSAAIHDGGALEDFYRVQSRTMRDLGSPVHGRRFFDQVLGCLGERAQILLVRHEGAVIGAAIALVHGDAMSIPWVSSLREHFDKCPNQVLYWTAMCHAIERGLRALDFGRSSRDSGTYEAKRQWGARPAQLYWHYHPAHAGPAAHDVSRFSWATRGWRRLPLPVTNVLGPRLRARIPN